MKGSANENHALRHSVEAVLTVAAEEAGAISWAIVQTLPVSNAARGQVVRYSLNSTEIVEFTFEARPDERQRKVLENSVSSVETLLSMEEERTRVFDQLARRVAQLELELANRKIVERAEGLRRDAAARDRSARLRLHVERVLKQRGIEELLQAHVQEVECRINDRNVVAAAKAVLQETLALSEEQAYRHLRSMSRRLRITLVDCALKVVGELPPPNAAGPRAGQ